MPRFLVGLVALVLSSATVVDSANAGGHGFAFHRLFFAHRPFHQSLAHRPFFFHHHRFFHPFFAFDLAFPFFVGPPVVVYPFPAYAGYPVAPAYGQGNCQQVQLTVMLNGQPQAAYGLACQQPDGTWLIVP
jgi:hypothetical protein